MAKLKKPPLGVEPLELWSVRIPEPTIVQFSDRFVAVCDAIERYQEAGLAPQAAWLRETGLDRFIKIGA